METINSNRTAQKLGQLNDSPGLGCMALQYVELCKDNCSVNGAVKCKPPEDNFTEVFAPNCGVELPTFGTISGLIVGRGPKYVEPSQAIAQVVVKDNKTLSLLTNTSHTEVGVGLIGFHKGGLSSKDKFHICSRRSRHRSQAEERLLQWDYFPMHHHQCPQNQCLSFATYLFVHFVPYSYLRNL